MRHCPRRSTPLPSWTSSSFALGEAHACLRRKASISHVDSVLVRRRGDAVASASHPDESRRRALEVAGECRLDGPGRWFAEERLDVGAHVASLHGVALLAQYLRDGVDDPPPPWMDGANRCPGGSRSAI